MELLISGFRLLMGLFLLLRLLIGYGTGWPRCLQWALFILAETVHHNQELKSRFSRGQNRQVCSTVNLILFFLAFSRGKVYMCTGSKCGAPSENVYLSVQLVRR